VRSSSCNSGGIIVVMCLPDFIRRVAE
jgi:hypothetical protein